MEKPVIGIISNRNESENGRVFQNNTSFSNLITERINTYNALCFGILFPNGIFDREIMNYCDGFIFQGGNKIELCQLLAMGYVMENKLPVLGICNGMQTMAGYDYTTQMVSVPSFYNLNKFYDKQGESGFLYQVDNHNKENPFYINNINNSKHKIYLEDYTFISSLYNGRSVIEGVSVHNYAVREEILNNSENFIISGRSSDGVIEAIESRDPDHFAIGVQFHLELDNQSNNVFENLVSEAKYVRKLKR